MKNFCLKALIVGVGVFLGCVAHARVCPTSGSKYELHSKNGSWADGEYVLTQRQESIFVDLDDLSIPTLLPTTQDTLITPADTPVVRVLSAPHPAAQIMQVTFKIIKVAEASCPLLLLISPNVDQAIAIKFSPTDGAPIGASRVDMSAVGSRASLSPENVGGSNGDQLVSRSSDGNLTGVFSVDRDSAIVYDNLLTVVAVWTDFIDKAAKKDPAALKYLIPSLGEYFSEPNRINVLANLKSIQKDFDVLEFYGNTALLATVLAKGGEDYLHYVTLERFSEGWRIIEM